MLTDENTEKVFCKDMPTPEEYYPVANAFQNASREKDFKKSQEQMTEAWHLLDNLMARCIARGMRLQLASHANPNDSKIINQLQDLLELSEKVKEPAIKAKMMAILQALSSK